MNGLKINKGLFYYSDFEGGEDQLTCYREFNRTLYMNATDYDCDKLLEPVTVDIDKTSENDISIYINTQTRSIVIVFEEEDFFNIQIMDS